MQKSLARRGIEAERAERRYASWVQQVCDWVDTTNFVIVGGRGVAKSTVIIARRSWRCVHDMPGAPLAIIADSYANLVNNIMPAVQNGWKLMGWLDGLHFMKGRRPPEEWRRRCSVIVDDYKHVYSFWNGTVLFMGSLDRPSMLAGKSVAHLFFDEAKFASDTRVSRVMPILRGNAVAYGRSHLYGGVTVTTDMPDVTEGEYDWFFRYASEMDPERIVKIVQAASIRNDYLLKLEGCRSFDIPDEEKIDRLERRVDYYDRALHKLRKGQTFFANISSFANIDILTVDYMRRLLEGGLEIHDFLKAVAGMRPGVRRDARFYVRFSDRHKYRDGTRSGQAAFDSSELRYLDPDKPLEGGMDFGNMLSLVVAQEDGESYRVHRNLFCLPPDWLRELADRFLEFFAPHRRKLLRLYYDRAGNNYQAQGEDMAGKFKDAVERDAEGRRTGWAVELMSRKQATIAQQAEFDFMQDLMAGQNRRLPTLLIDALNCPELVCSIEGARAEVKHVGDKKVVKKVKKTEKLEPKKLPRLSTNFSDAFKYLMMRRSWVEASRAQSGRGPTTGGASAAAAFLAHRQNR